MASLFEDMFDFNHDGELSSFEKTMRYEFLEGLGKNEKHTEDTEEDMELELELSGLDPDELEFMDPDERREALEDAGLDPDEYDFY